MRIITPQAGVAVRRPTETMNESDKQQPLEKRIIALEESLMHVERLVKELNEVACSIQDRLDGYDRMIAHLVEVTGQLEGEREKKRTLEDDRPPHY